MSNEIDMTKFFVYRKSPLSIHPMLVGELERFRKTEINYNKEILRPRHRNVFHLTHNGNNVKNIYG